VQKNKKEEHTMTNKFFIKTLVKCFGEANTIQMLNQLQKPIINKKARKYKAKLKI